MENKLLIGGDYSGIQSYIYNITSKYASNNLKGRSDCLKMDCEATAEKVRGAVQGETIISSGGTFLILADNTKANIETLDKLIAEEERLVYDTYGTDIYLAIDYIALYDCESYQDATHKLFLKRDAKKNRRMSSIIKDNYGQFFEPLQWHYDKTDAITGAYFKNEKEMKKCDGIDGFVTAQTLSQIERGEELARRSNRRHNLNTLTNYDKGADLIRLGVLRMDVDNLGAAFQKEIAKCKSDLTDYRQLSQCFTKFFDEKNLYQYDTSDDNLIYIVYSGGDDIFAVGRWDNAIAFAEKVREGFAKQSFVKDRNLSISGGVAILPHKYPIMKGAAEGGELEDLAKDHKVGSAEKNSIAFLDMALNWDEEYQKVKDLKDEIIRIFQNESSFRSKISRHFYNAEVRDHKITNVRTYWMLTYDLGRLKQRNAKDPEVVSIINNCITEICGNKNILNGQFINTDYHPIELWALACRWAELEIRTTKK